jgi:hypothetical protein
MSKDLNSINNNVIEEVSRHISKDNEDISELNNNLVENISLLNNLYDKIYYDENYIFVENQNLKIALTNAITSNIYLYDNLNYLISNVNEINTTYDLNKFIALKDNCIINYHNLINNYNLKFNFIDDVDSLFQEYYYYLNETIKTNRDAAFREKQNQGFLMKLESLNKNISYLNEDLLPAIDKIREENRDLLAIIDDIYKKEEVFNNMKTELYSISIPEGYDKIYSSLQEYLNIYEAYLKAIKSSAIYEKTCSDLDKYSKEINKNYKNSSSKRKDVLDAYSNYLKYFEKN